MTEESSKNGALIPVDAALVAKIGMAAYRAPSLLQPHRVQEALADAHAGKIPPIIGFFCGLSSPPIGKLVAQLGYDVVCVDWEHASLNVETMTQMVHDIQFISEGKSMAFVRVPGHDHASIGYVLDAGASIIVPQIETVEQAQHIVSAAKYGASINGTRSAPPARYLSGISDTCLDPSLTFHQNMNNQAAIIIQIETLLGIQNLDAILNAVGEHIDSVWIGSLDARISMGISTGGLIGEEEEWKEAMKLYEGTLAKHNMPASGLALGPPEMKKTMSRGKSFMVVVADYFVLQRTKEEDLGFMRENYGAVCYEGTYEKI